MKKDLTIDDIYDELNDELYGCEDIDDVEKILSEFGEVSVVDDKIDDGDDTSSEDEYVMLRCYDVVTETGTLYVKVYYGNNTGKTGYYTIDIC